MSARDMLKSAGRAAALAETYCRAGTGSALEIGILSDGAEQYAHWEGGGLAPGPDGRAFEYGSITKTFTGSLLCELLYEGRISLKDRVSDYIPGLPGGYYYPTIEQLATHTAGYGETLPLADGSLYKPCEEPDFESRNPFERYDERDVDAFAANARLERGVFPPAYSNLGVTILARILGIVLKNTARGALESFIDSGLGLGGMTSLGRPRGSCAAGRGEDGSDCGNWLWGESPFACMGGLYGSAEGLLRYAGRQLAPDPACLALGHAPRAVCFEPGCMTGLCWLIYPEDGIIWHNGGTGCFKTFLGISKSKNAAAVALSNQKARGGVTPETIGLEILRSL